MNCTYASKHLASNGARNLRSVRLFLGGPMTLVN